MSEKMSKKPRKSIPRKTLCLPLLELSPFFDFSQNVYWVSLLFTFVFLPPCPLLLHVTGRLSKVSFRIRFLCRSHSEHFPSCVYICRPNWRFCNLNHPLMHTLVASLSAVPTLTRLDRCWGSHCGMWLPANWDGQKFKGNNKFHFYYDSKSNPFVADATHAGRQ